MAAASVRSPSEVRMRPHLDRARALRYRVWLVLYNKVYIDYYLQVLYDIKL